MSFLGPPFRALGAAPPQVNVAGTPVSVQVFVDAELVAKKVAESLGFTSRTSNSSFDHDGRLGFAGPDVRN